MPSSVGPNVKGEENLVFGYDLSDNYNSYIGEPATNSQAYGHSAMTQEGFDAWGCYDGTNSSPAYHSWDVAQSKTLVNIPGPYGRNVNAMLYHNFTGGFHGPTHWSGIPGSALTANTSIVVQGWVKAADAASVGKTVTPYIYYYLSGGGSASSSTNFTLTSQWQLVSHVHNITTAGTSGILYFFTGGGTNIKMYLTMTGAIPNKSHAVRWPAGGTTRSVTQGLLDLTGNLTVDLTNVSFDSNAQMTFDGSNDYISIPNTTSYGNFTAEVVIKPTSNPNNAASAISTEYPGTNSTVNFTIGFNGSNFKGGFYNDSSGGWHEIFTSLPTLNVYTHYVLTYNGTQMVLYKNGTSVGTLNTTDIAAGGNPIRIGRRWDLAEYFPGDIDVAKVYDRALTASEVKSNFNALKGRFNI